jgi:hypothetical protein
MLTDDFFFIGGFLIKISQLSSSRTGVLYARHIKPLNVDKSYYESQLMNFLYPGKRIALCGCNFE